MHIAQVRELVQQVLVRLDIEQDGRTAAMLGENDGTAGLMELIQEGGCIRPEFCHRANILRRAKTGHQTLLNTYVSKYGERVDLLMFGRP
jgi:hypothetical protein